MFIVRWLSTDGRWVPALLFAEGLLAAVLGLVFAAWLFAAEASLVAIFFTALAAQDAAEKMLDWNREAIFEQGRSPRSANLRLTLQLAALFLGCTGGYAAAALVLPMGGVEVLFSHQLEDYAGASVQSMNFGTVPQIWVHNVTVMLFFFVVALPFRHGGVMLALAWNASVWGATFAWLARRWSETGGPSVPEAYVRVVLSTVTHLTAEAMAFTLAGLAGVFIAKGTLKHGLGSDVMASIEHSVRFMLAGALALVTFGAVWESLVAPLLMDWLAG